MKKFFAFWVVTVVFGAILGLSIGAIDALTAVETYEYPFSSPEELAKALALMEEYKDETEGRTILEELRDDDSEITPRMRLEALRRISRTKENQDPNEFCSKFFDYCNDARAEFMFLPTTFSFLFSFVGFIVVRTIYSSFKIVFNRG